MKDCVKTKSTKQDMKRKQDVEKEAEAVKNWHKADYSKCRIMER